MKNLTDMTDEELALSYSNGNNRAFDLLLSRNQSKVFSYIMYIVRNRDIADDIFQDTFVKVVIKLQQNKYSTSGKFSAWVMRIAHNLIIDWFREQKNSKVTELSKDNDLSNIKFNSIFAGNIENDFVNMQVLADVEKLMNHLPHNQREVLFMRFYQDLSFKEIAEQTNVSINTALGRMRYAVLNMRKMAKENHTTLALD